MKTGSAAIVAVEVLAAKIAADPARAAAQDRRSEALRERVEPVGARRVRYDPRTLFASERGELLGKAEEVAKVTGHERNLARGRPERFSPLTAGEPAQAAGGPDAGRDAGVMMLDAAEAASSAAGGRPPGGIQEKW
jgi:hypothetical protein